MASLSELAREHGVNVKTLRSRLEAGVPLEKALSPRLFDRDHKRRPDSITGRARAAGLKPSTVRERMSQGMSLEEALSTPLQRGPVQVTLELCLQHRISQKTVRYRMDTLGMTLQEALETPVDETRSRLLTAEQRIVAATGKPVLEAVKELRARGVSMRVAAQRLDCGYGWLLRFCREHGIPKGTSA